VVGVALGLASRTAGSSGHDLSTIETSPSTPEEVAARAILAEGALQAVLGLDAAKAADLGILSRMQEIYEMNKEAVTAFAPVIGPTILAPTIQPALMEIAHDDPSEIKFPEINISSADEAIMANIGFVQDLQQAAQIHTTSTDEKGFWDIMKVVSKVAAEAPKMAAQAAIDQMKNLASSNAPLIQTHDLMALETFALNQSSPNEIAANTIGAVSTRPQGRRRNFHRATNASARPNPAVLRDSPSSISAERSSSRRRHQPARSPHARIHGYDSGKHQEDRSDCHQSSAESFGRCRLEHRE
jgi:hypothetical protein